MNIDDVAVIARVRRNMPRNADDVMRLRDLVEAVTVTPVTVTAPVYGMSARRHQCFQHPRDEERRTSRPSEDRRVTDSFF